MRQSLGSLLEKPELDCLLLENLAIFLNPLLRQESRDQFTRPAC